MKFTLTLLGLLLLPFISAIAVPDSLTLEENELTF
ncbi:Protein of unknown function [Pyronema omphalodes CBS 100304]|uniref:Uncharacterized protein n=1 Tax=Pyronema omphalodes (strain CBS 100304) TaxID=1076935 RepID=U4LPZ7_PYROM|nr:Protein of unknown function [Pyronema omphalodes CBS 100304]